jgi:mono/diheme cytochrome c family protein
VALFLAGAGADLRAARRSSRVRNGAPGVRVLPVAGVAFGLLSIVAQAHPIVAGFERFYADAAGEARAADGGLLLLNELNCVACHAAPAGWSERLPGRAKISLAGVGQRWRGEGFGAFIGAPAQVKPGTLMPQLRVTDVAANNALAAYVASIPAPGSEPPAAKIFPAGDAQRGERLFHSVGCVACHAPGDATNATTQTSVPIALAAHYDRAALAAFLLDPLHSRPAGRMPRTELSAAEAADLAVYLNPSSLAAPSAPAPADLVTGRAQFAALGCAACHETGEKHDVKMAKPLAVARIGEGCLATNPAAGAPRFGLSEPQVRALAAALRAIQSTPGPPTLTPSQRVAAKFEQLNCYACHEWRGRGGVEAARAKHFKATDSAAESLGEMGHLPPKLDQAGRKLTPAWLEKLLWGTDGGVRPYLTVRMPRFGPGSTADLVPLLADACRPERRQEIDTSGGKGHQRFATGRTLLGAGTGGLGCVSCHGVKNREPSGARAINLTHTAQRLQPEYFKALLLDPQSTQPGTIMPPLLASRKDAGKDVESIWTYFKELDQSDVLPEGLALAGSFELKPDVDGRPIIFRTFLEGAGMQAVAVGFPASLHAAFDAFEVRWALVWRGRFLDAQSNWEERPMKPIKALGDARRALPTHQPLAQLCDATEAWPTTFGRYAGYVFKGYRLGSSGVPTFRYAVAGLEVEDTLEPAADGRSLRRTVTVRGGGADATGWYFRGLANDSVPQPLEWRNGTAIFEETLTF